MAGGHRARRSQDVGRVKHRMCIRRTGAVTLVFLAAVGWSASPASAGTITTVALNGQVGFSGDGGPATSAGGCAGDVSPTSDGGFLLADQCNDRIRKVSSTGTIDTVAGTGQLGFSGDNGPATSAMLADPSGVVTTPDGGFLIADSGNLVIRKVSAGGTITTVAGEPGGGPTDDYSCSYTPPLPGNPPGFCANGGPATQVALGPSGSHGAFQIAVAVTPTGGLLIADRPLNRVLALGSDGTITSVAGDGSSGFSGDGGPATSAALNSPIGIAVTSDGGFLIGDTGNNRVRKVSSDGTLTTVAGNGAGTFCGTAECGDGGPATAATVDGPEGVAVTADSGFLIADGSNNRIRKVSADGTITTVAGDGFPDNTGDGGPATAAGITAPYGVAPTPGGGFLIADSYYVRSVTGAGAVAILAGPTGRIGQATGSFTFEAIGDSSPEYECALDGSAFAPCSSPFSFGSLADGQHRFQVRDHPNGTDPGPAAERDWTIDTSAPAVAFDQVPSGSGNPHDQTIAFHGTDADDDSSTLSFTCQLDHEVPYGCTSPQRLAALSDGAHSFSVYAVDGVGNAGNAAVANWDVGGTCAALRLARTRKASSASCPIVPPTCPADQVNKATLGLAIVAIGCFTQKTADGKAISYSSSGVVGINGLQVDPSSGTETVLDNAKGEIRFTGPFTLHIGVIPIHIEGRTSWSIALHSALFKVLLPGFSTVKEPLLGMLNWVDPPGLEFSADNGGQTKITLKVKLPKMFGTNPGSEESSGELSGEFSATASNSNGTQYTGKLQAAEAWMFGVAELKNLSLAIDSGIGTYGTDAYVPPSIEGGVTLLTTKPVPGKSAPEVSLALGFGPGGCFKVVRRVSASIAKLNVPLAYGIYAQRIGAELTCGPAFATIAGSLGVSLGPRLEIPSFFDGDIAALDGSIKWTFPFDGDPNKVKVELSGAGKIVEVPVGNMTATATLSKLTIAGTLDLTVNGFGLQAAILDDSFFDLNSPYEFNVHARGSLDFYLWKAESEVVLSRKGLAACASTDGGARYGFGYYWGQAPSVFSSSCDVGPYTSTSQASARHAGTSAASQFTVAPHTKLEVIEADGTAAVPAVTLNGPGGIQISGDSADPIHTSQALVLADAAGKRRFFLLSNPAPGSWAVTPNPGSELSGVRTAHNLPAVNVNAQVGGHGPTRTLSWSLTPIARQQVTFVELGPQTTHTLLTTSRAKGHIRFRPGRDPGSARRVVALVTQEGLPRDQLVVAHFTFVAPRLTKVRGIRVRGRILTWHPEAAAARYAVGVDGAKGGRGFVVRRAKLALPADLFAKRLSIRLVAIDSAGRFSKPTVVKVTTAPPRSKRRHR